MFNLNIKTKHFFCKGPLANKTKSVSMWKWSKHKYQEEMKNFCSFYAEMKTRIFSVFSGDITKQGDKIEIFALEQHMVYS